MLLLGCQGYLYPLQAEEDFEYVLLFFFEWPFLYLWKLQLYHALYLVFLAELCLGLFKKQLRK